MCHSGNGRIELAISRMEIVQQKEFLCIRDWYLWAFSRRLNDEVYNNNQYRSLRRALQKTHICVGQPRKPDGTFGPAIWRKRTADDPPLPPRKRWDKPRRNDPVLTTGGTEDTKP